MDLRRHVNSDPRRGLPGVDRLCQKLLERRPDLPAWAATEVARSAIEEARRRLATSPGGIRPDGEPNPEVGLEAEGWVEEVLEAALRLASAAPRSVLNATGVVLHTNLGRAPMAEGAAMAAARVAAGYCDLELDLETGRRGNRLSSLAAKLQLLSGSEAATVCNNNAGAVLLVLNTLARGREVIVSRGELVEIGGSFRVPDIMERAGVRLVEVGTTNRTHPEDYRRAIGPETALLLKVHRSNFEQRGFVTEVSIGDLAYLGREHGLPVVEDLGSGTLVDLTARGFPADAFAPARLRMGADLVCFSGDKLMGGPQAGLILGGASELERIRRNPLARALRLDKMSIAALDWTLSRMLDGSAIREIPVLRQLLEPAEVLEERAQRLAERLTAVVRDAAAVGVSADRAPVGGGSLPGFELDSWVVALRPERDADGLSERLRGGGVPVLTRVRDGAVLFDLRTLAERDFAEVVAAVELALR